MPTNNIPRQMIVQSRARGCNMAQVLLTNRTTLDLEQAHVPVMAVPECSNLPLTKKMSEYWQEHCHKNGREPLTMSAGSEEATILTNNRNHPQFKYVGLVHSRGYDAVECWDENGEPESGNLDHKLGEYPQEKYGCIAIYRGIVTAHLYETSDAAVRGLKDENNITEELNLEEVFVIDITAWTDNNERVI